jgi:outer membrane lipoprotein-sorting protein
MTENGRPMDRDDELGAALRTLEVPGHEPGFYAELRRRLEDERPARTRSTRPPLRERRTLRWTARAAAVALVIGIVFVAVGVPPFERAPTGPAVASAAEIKAHVRAALADMRTLTGAVVQDGPEQGDERRWRFTLSAEGDFRLAGPARGEVIAYDAASGVVRSAQRSASAGGDTLFYAVRRGVAPGLPDHGPPGWALPDEFAAFVRAALAAGDPRVRDVVYEGRPAWELVVDARPNAIVPELSGDRFRITVDRETAVPVRVQETRRGAFLREIRIEQLAVDPALPPDVFEVDFPPGAEVLRMDDGFRRVGLDDVADVAGYAPLVPGWIPDGYELAEVAVAEEAGPTGTEAGNPRSRGVVSLSYRRGFDQFLVTTRLADPGPGAWGDPLATGEGFVDHPEAVTLSQGALEGADAELVIAPRGVPHLWGIADGLVVTVGGDLGRDELVRVAESLRARR